MARNPKGARIAALAGAPSVRTARLEINRSGYYEIRYSEPDPDTGVWRTQSESCRTKDRATAQGLLDRFRADERAGAPSPSEILQKMTIGDWLDDYAVSMRGRGVDLGNIKQMERVTVGVRHLLPREFDARAQKIYLSSLGPLSSSSKRKYIAHIVSALNRAVKTKQLSPVDTPYIELPPGGQPRERWLNEREEALLHAAAVAMPSVPKPDRPMIGGGRGRASFEMSDALARSAAIFTALALNTAARREAIRELTWDRVDFAARMIDYRKPGRRVTRKRRAMVPINSRLMAVLTAERERLRAVLPADVAAWGRVVERANVYQAFAAVCRSLGLRGVSPHTCRHTWATLAARRGVSMYEIAGVLGDTIQTVTDNYLKHAPDHLRRAVEIGTPVAASMELENAA
jgi:integrase